MFSCLMITLNGGEVLLDFLLGFKLDKLSGNGKNDLVFSDVTISLSSEVYVGNLKLLF